MDLTDITLKKGQQQALDGMIEWACTPLLEPTSDEDLRLEQRARKLEGVAGTGKTFLAAVFISELIRQGIYYPQDFAILAPTHKAKKVLAKNFRDMNLGVEPPMTIHSAFGLSPMPDHRGKLRLKGRGDIGDGVKFIVFDEFSMIGTELWGYSTGIKSLELAKWIRSQNPYVRGDLLRYADTVQKAKLLFMGDPFQIPPIKEEFSPAMNLEGWFLDEIVRYGGPIQELSTKIRHGQYDGMRSETPEIFRVDNRKMFESSYLKEIEKGDLVDMDTGTVRCALIAWTNKRVNSISEKTRETIFGDDMYTDDGDVIPFLEGEYLACSNSVFVVENNSPNYTTYSEEDRLYTNDIVRVMYVNETKEANFGFKVWELHLEVAETWNRYDVHVLHEDSEQEFRDTLKEIKNLAISMGSMCDKIFKARKEQEYHIVETLEDEMLKLRRTASQEYDIGMAMDNKKASKAVWRIFYEAQNHFATFSSPFALTAHKSQGSGFKQVWVDAQDINRNRNSKERPKILYTAVTRTKKDLKILPSMG